MMSEKITVISDIAQLMIDNQMKYSLPVNIIVGDSFIDENGDEQQELVCEYEAVNYHAFAWLVNLATVGYITDVNNSKEKGGANEND